MSTSGDPLVELGFALAEGEAEEPPTPLRSRVLEAAAAIRTPGRSVDPGPHVSGVDVFSMMVRRVDALLAELGEAEWARPAIRGLDVQGLVGHLIGVERQFGLALEGTGGSDESADHVASTQPTALGQAGRAPAATLDDWRAATAHTIAISGPETREMSFYGAPFPLDALLVLRSFEMWIHDEDIRHATGRPLPPLDAATLTRMTALAIELLPGALTRVGCQGSGVARLVLTGPGGGAFDVPLDDRAVADAPRVTRVVIDATDFCRNVGNRPARPPALVTGDEELARSILVAAGTLALD